VVGMGEDYNRKLISSSSFYPSHLPTNSSFCSLLQIEFYELQAARTTTREFFISPWLLLLLLLKR